MPVGIPSFRIHTSQAVKGNMVRRNCNAVMDHWRVRDSVPPVARNAVVSEDPVELEIVDEAYKSSEWAIGFDGLDMSRCNFLVIQPEGHREIAGLRDIHRRRK